MTNHFAQFQDRKPVAIVVGTGPSLTGEQCKIINDARWYGDCIVFAVNKAWEVVDTDVLHACNFQFYKYYMSDDEHLSKSTFHKWTTRPELKGKYEGLNYIEERWIDGLSTDQSYIAAHHGSGPQAVNLAYHYGCKKILLVGWDMRHKGKRHFFGEYPEPLVHITRNLGPDGELIGLIKEMETIKPAEYGIEIINCTPGSAMTCFPMGDLEKSIYDN